MRAFCLLFPAIAAAIALPATARAEDKAAAPKARPLTLETSIDVVSGKVSGGNITKTGARLGLAYDVTRRFTLRIGVGYDAMRIGYQGPLDDGFKVDATMWSYAGLSGNAGASYRLYDGRRFRLDGFLDFEASIYHSHPVITSLDATTPQGTFDITPYANQNAGGSIFWMRFAGGARGRFIFGRWEPNLAIAFQRVESTLDLHLNEDSRKTVSRLGYDPLHIEGRHDLSFWSIPITPGLDVRIRDRAWIGVNGTFAPAGDNWLWGGALLFRYAL